MPWRRLAISPPRSWSSVTVSSSMIASARRMRSCDGRAVALAHGVGGLEEEAQAAVVEHHHEAPGRGGEDALLPVGGRLIAGVGGQGGLLVRGTEGINLVVGLEPRVLRLRVRRQREIWLVSQACCVCELLIAVSIAANCAFRRVCSVVHPVVELA